MLASGDNPNLVLIHGSPGNAHTWKGVVDRLEGYRTIVSPSYLDDIDPLAPLPTVDVARTIEATWPAGDPPLVVGHSYGSNVALHIAFGGNVPIGALILLEPVAMRVLVALGRDAQFAPMEAAFIDYLAQVDAKAPDAVATMVDFWFGPGAFEKMPPPMQDFLRAQTPTNAVNVRASFEERYDAGALKALTMPALVAWGGASPPENHQVSTAVADALGNAELVCVDGATHAMPQTHPAEIAALIEDMAKFLRPD